MDRWFVRALEWIAHIHLATRLLSDRATLLPLRVQTKDAATAAAGRVTNCARSLLSEHFSSSYRSGQPGHKASSNAMRCAAPSMRYHAENNKAQAERVRQLQALHESWLAYLPTHRARACSFKGRGSGKSKEASERACAVRAGGAGRDGMGSRQRQIIEALSIDVRSAISDPPAAMRCDATVPICAVTMMSTARNLI